MSINEEGLVVDNPSLQLGRPIGLVLRPSFGGTAWLTAEDVRFVHGHEIRKYRKTAVIEAFQMVHDFYVDTLEGRMHGEAGDYLAIGVAGEMYPVKREIFEATYEEDSSET